MFVRKVHALAAGLLAVTLLAGPAARATAPTSAAPGQGTVKVRADRHGDPLPAGALARLGTARFRHSGRVTFVGFSRDGRALLSAGRGGWLRAEDAATGRELWRCSLRRTLESMPPTLSGDGSTVALIRGAHLLVLDASSGKERRRFAAAPLRGANPKEASVPSFSLSHDGNTLLIHATEGDKSEVTLWHVATGKRGRRIQSDGGLVITAAALTPDGRFLAVFSGDAEQPEGKGGRLQFWEVASGKPFRTVKVPVSQVSELHFLPDGKRLLAFDRAAPQFSLLEAATGKRLGQVALPEELPTSFAVSADGKRLCLAGGDGLTLWEIATRKRVGRLPLPFPDEEKAPLVAFAPDGKSLAVTGGQVVTVVDLGTGRTRPVLAGHGSSVTRLAFSPVGARLLSISEEEARVWDARSGKELHRLARQRTQPAQRAEPGGGPELLEDLDLKGVGASCAFAPDGQAIAAVWAGEPIHLWDAVRGKLLRQLRAPTPQQRLAYSPDGVLASAGEDGVVRLWDTRTGKQRKQLMWRRAADKGKSGEKEERVTAGVAFAPDGKAVVAAGALVFDGERTETVLTLWEVATGTPRLEVITPSVQPVPDRNDLLEEVLDLGNVGLSLALSPDGSTLAVGGLTSIRLWDTTTGKDVRQFGGPAVICWTAAFSADGKLLAAGRTDGKLRVWDVATGTVLRDFPAHSGPVTAVVFAPDGKTVATGSADTTVLVWDLAEVLRDSRPPPKRAASAAELRALWADLGSKDGARAYRAMAALRRAGAAGVATLKEGLLPAGKAPSQAVGIERGLRAIEVLERVGTAEARAALQALARPASEAALAREASASLKRLARRAPRP